MRGARIDAWQTLSCPEHRLEGESSDRSLSKGLERWSVVSVGRALGPRREKNDQNGDVRPELVDEVGKEVFGYETLVSDLFSRVWCNSRRQSLE